MKRGVRLATAGMVSLLAVVAGVFNAQFAFAREDVVRSIEEFDEVRELAMRALIRAQEVKTAYLYGRGFKLDMPEYVPEDMLVEGLWLFDYMHSLDSTATSLLSYATAEDHPHLDQELGLFRAYTSEAARKTIDYYDRAANALNDAVRRVNNAAVRKTPFYVETIPSQPWSDDPAVAASAGDGFNLGFAWPMIQDESTRLGRFLKQHGYPQDYVMKLGARAGINFVRPEDRNLFDWIDVETKEGVCDWTRIDKLLALCKKHGMALWMAIPSYTTSPPQWLRDRLGNRAVLTGRKGEPLFVGSRGWDRETGLNDKRRGNNPVNLFDPEVSKAFARYLQALVGHVMQSGVKITAIELGSRRPLPWSYGQPTDARWQAWMQRNNIVPKERWGMEIDVAECVLPDYAKPPADAGPGMARMMMDILRWREDESIEYLRVQVETIRATAPAVPICAHACESGESNHESMNGRSNERLVRELGLMSFGYANPPTIWDDLRRAYSPVHWSATKAYVHWWDTPAQYSAASYVHGTFTTMCAVTPLARGFFRGNSYWYPDLRLRSSSLRGWRRFQERAQGMAPEMINTRPAPQVAVMWSDTSNRFHSTIHDYATRWDTTANYHKVGCVGWDRILNSMYMPHDFITEDQVRQGKLAQYEMLIMPAVQALPADVVQKIREYARNGGVLVATSAPALYGADMQQKGTGQLADVFSADFDHFLGRSIVAQSPLHPPVPDQALFQYWNGPDPEKVETNSDSLRTLYCTYKPREGAEVLFSFTNGEPAVIVGPRDPVSRKSKTALIGYPLGRESKLSNAYHEAMGQTWSGWPNGTLFQQGLFRWFEYLLLMLDFERDAVVNEEDTPRPIGQDAGWPCWQWTRKGGGYRDYVWKTASAAPRSLELAIRKREGNSNLYLTVLNREGGYGLDPGLTHFESISKQIRIEFPRRDFGHIYDVSLGCAVPFTQTRTRMTIDEGTTTFRTMIEPLMARMFVLTTVGHSIRLYEGNRSHGRDDHEIRENVKKLATDIPVPKHVIIGAKDVVMFVAGLGGKKITISAESPTYLPAAERLAAVLRKLLDEEVRITRNSPRIRGVHRDVGAWHSENQTRIEEPDILLGSHNESHYIAAERMHALMGHVGRHDSHTPRLPMLTSHTFPGPGRSVVMLLRPFTKYGAIGDEASGKLFAERPAPSKLVIGASDPAGLEAGVEKLIELIRGTEE